MGAYTGKHSPSPAGLLAPSQRSHPPHQSECGTEAHCGNSTACSKRQRERDRILLNWYYRHVKWSSIFYGDFKMVYTYCIAGANPGTKCLRNHNLLYYKNSLWVKSLWVKFLWVKFLWQAGFHQAKGEVR